MKLGRAQKQGPRQLWGCRHRLPRRWRLGQKEVAVTVDRTVWSLQKLTIEDRLACRILVQSESDVVMKDTPDFKLTKSDPKPIPWASFHREH